MSDGIDQGQFADRLGALTSEMVSQCRHVARIVDAAVDAAFDGDASRAERIVAEDRIVDATDVRIEKMAVDLLNDAIVTPCTEDARNLSPMQVRMLLTIVKVNNEAERIADLAVTIAQRIESLSESGESLPPRFRMVANSVLGLLQETVTAFDTLDASRAESVLRSDDAIEAFRDAILHESERELEAGTRSADFAFSLNRVAAALARIADHSTNICEQVIYVATGKIVRHHTHEWSEPELPGD